MAKQKTMRVRLRESLTPAAKPNEGHTANEVAAALGADAEIDAFANVLGVPRERLAKEIVRAACHRGELACVGFRLVTQPNGKVARELVYTPANDGIPVFMESKE